MLGESRRKRALSPFIAGLCAVIAACSSESPATKSSSGPPPPDPCAPEPCQNGASCARAGDSYACACPAGFSGKDCETNVDDCTPNPCSNGGVCTDQLNGHSCTCAPGFVGADCGTTSCVGLADGTACNDSDACTSGDACQAGVCQSKSTLACGCTPGVDCDPTGYHYASETDPAYHAMTDQILMPHANGQPTPAGASFTISFRFPNVRSFDAVSLDIDVNGKIPLDSVAVSFSNDGVTFAKPLTFSTALGNLPTATGSILPLDLGGQSGAYVSFAIELSTPADGVDAISFGDPCRISGTCNSKSGSCDFVARPDGETCGVAGTCQAGLCTNCGVTGKVDCAGTCADLQTDAANCGACAKPCVAGDSCHAGTCSGCSALGKTDCGDGACRDLSSDPFDCGVCGTACTSGALCVSGSCKSYPYPTGPYGTAVGDVIDNLSFSGMTDQNHDGLVQNDPVISIPLSQYQHVDGVNKTKVLLITLSAVWCGPCKLEEPQLVSWYADYETWAPGRVKLITLLSQTAASTPATNATMISWAKLFKIPYDVGLDPDAQQLSAFLDAGQALAYPFHILVDTQGMTIAGKFVGADLTTLKPVIDAILAAPPDPLTPP